MSMRLHNRKDAGRHCYSIALNLANVRQQHTLACRRPGYSPIPYTCLLVRMKIILPEIAGVARQGSPI